MKTAIEWLFDEINNQKCWADPKILNPLFEQAKQKEREQIESAFEKGGEEFSNAYKQTIYHGSKYYETTFKK